MPQHENDRRIWLEIILFFMRERAWETTCTSITLLLSGWWVWDAIFFSRESISNAIPFESFKALNVSTWPSCENQRRGSARRSPQFIGWFSPSQEVLCYRSQLFWQLVCNVFCFIISPVVPQLRACFCWDFASNIMGCWISADRVVGNTQWVMTVGLALGAVDFVGQE